MERCLFSTEKLEVADEVEIEASVETEETKEQKELTDVKLSIKGD